jgi:hypothetical protein
MFPIANVAISHLYSPNNIAKSLLANFFWQKIGRNRLITLTPVFILKCGFAKRASTSNTKQDFLNKHRVSINDRNVDI